MQYVKREKEESFHGRLDSRKALARNAQEAAHAEGRASGGLRLQDRPQEEVPAVRNPDDCGVRDGRGGEGPFRRRFAPKCPSSQQPVFSGQWEADGVPPVHWLLVAGCWLLKHFGRRPSKVDRIGLGHHGRRHFHRREAPEARAHEGREDAVHRKRLLEALQARHRAGQGRYP